MSREDGAYVLLADGVELPIPPILTPIVLGGEEQAALANDARLLLSAIAKVARDLLDRGDPAMQAQLFAPLSSLERAALDATHREAEHLATARVDFLVGEDGRARALEVNATIPAMQGYADAVAAAWIRAVGEQRACSGDKIEAAIARNGRNTDDLLASLLAHHAAVTGNRDDRPRAIAIVARPHDSQSGELDHYVRRWRALGHEVWRVTPDEVAPGANGPTAAGRAADLLYRHVFLRRLEPNSPLSRMLLDPHQHRVWNPPASLLELKGKLGLLSAAHLDDARSAHFGLSFDERTAAARRLPWTRLCTRTPARGPEGRKLDDVLAFARGHQDELVLKRSWDYGGRGVFLGAELDEPMSQARLRELLAVNGEITWPMLVDHIERSGEAWVVQSLVDVRPATSCAWRTPAPCDARSMPTSRRSRASATTSRSPGAPCAHPVVAS